MVATPENMMVDFTAREQQSYSDSISLQKKLYKSFLIFFTVRDTKVFNSNLISTYEKTLFFIGL